MSERAREIWSEIDRDRDMLIGDSFICNMHISSIIWWALVHAAALFYNAITENLM